LGNSNPKNTRVADTQKCLRVSGKHNDLEEVGIDTYHHTMFEMLGNWSFGDYFKQEAIEWAWELLTEVYKIDKKNIYITVFAGDEKDGLPKDEEAFQIWKKYIDEDRILAFSKKDNFWEMGETGPCGPCSEIHVDIRNEADKAKIDGKTFVNNDHPQVIEIWNLVFMEFNRYADGSLKPLPNKHIDTGMGFERLSMVLQGKQSNYDTDVFAPFIQKLSSLSNIKYTHSDSKSDVAIRVISDHLRAISFSIADGQLPSNTGAGYVIRRILRRAVRYGYTYLNFNEPTIYKLVEILVEQMSNPFQELSKQKSLIEKVIKEEEESFLRTLSKGIQLFEDYVANIKDKSIEGKFAFELYDTFGFPIDLTQLMASEKQLHVDMNEFLVCLEEQKQRSRKAGAIVSGDWHQVGDSENQEFIGYDYLSSEVKIMKYRSIENKGEKLYQLVFNHTPFYPEGGGQVGDTGTLINGAEIVEIINTKKENDLIVHFSKILPNKMNEVYLAKINEQKRFAAACNHSATHLLHEALRTVLGTHVEQKGSLVNAEYLRFDFSHFQKVTQEELEKIEQIVNEKIRNAVHLEEMRETPINKAKELGAMALFGEKYGDVVRVIKFGSSVELCGGTHVKNTAQIGYIKITSESAVAAGIRRIEAISSDVAFHYINEKLSENKAVAELLKNPKNIIQSIEELMKQNQELNKKIEQFSKSQAKELKKELIANMEIINGVHFIGKKVNLDASAIKDLAFQLKSEIDNLFLIIGSDADNKATITVSLSDSLVKDKGMNAGKIVKELSVHIEGGGGGQPFFATAGGKNSSGIDKSIEQAKLILS
jgi:alanyl-tRNA synthetase